MDPAMYARAYGVQSEANKVTVTRVAGGEIGYRRVVNTYRRDMNSTVNGIKREQKKLRRCMRGYRKKLYGDKKKKPKPFKFGWIANTHPDVDEDLRYSDSLQGKKSSQREMTHMSGKFKNNNQQDVDFSLTKANTSSQIQPLQAQVEAFLKAPNIKLKKKSGEGNDSVGGDKRKKKFGKERRLFVIGSGKIRSSQKTMQDILRGDEGDVSYSSVSDSSEDEGSHGGSPIAKRRDEKSFKRRLGETQGGIIRANSAYFKPMPMSDCEELRPEGNKDETNIPLPNKDEQEIAVPTNIKDVFDKRSDSSNGISSNDDQGNATGPRNELSLPTILPLNQKGESTDLRITEKTLQPKSSDVYAGLVRKTDKSRKGVSFGDIAKLQHGLKTKKLFSLVDQLASRHGIVEDAKIKDNYNMGNPVPKSVNKRTFKRSSGEGSSTLTTYSSVFYTMKYGYGQSTPDSHIDSDLSSATTLRDKEDRFGSLSITTDSRLGSERTQTLSTMLSHVDIHANNLSRNSAVKCDGSFPSQSIKFIDSDMSGTFLSGVSRSTGLDGNEKGVQQKKHRENRYHRQRRRSSMLEVSQYVNSLRNKDASKKTSFSTEMGSFDKRRDSAISSDDNELMPDIHKVAWSSALSRIKLVHTLADLTHII